ncbi:MAG: hypothetical protein U9Q83_06915, partial [Bacteroidota bacterium]|nr:hypothetical protein [Bacteroidota bacterium]
MIVDKEFAKLNLEYSNHLIKKGELLSVLSYLQHANMTFDTLNDFEHILTLYKLGELNTKLGNYSKAILFFERVLEKANKYYSSNY